MCLIVFGLHAHPRYPLVVAANRDEFLARPSEPAHFWKVGLAAERILSPPFIAAPGYGTRGSTLLLVTSTGRATFLERRFDGTFSVAGTTRFELGFRAWNPPRRVS